MTPRAYASPEAFKQALEQRLRTATQTGPRLARQRQLLVFQRFLGRIVAIFGDAVTLKGGLRADRVQCPERLGGTLRFYHREAA